MNISFGQIYPEVATSFHLSSALVGRLRERLSICHLEIPELAAKFGGDDFELVFIISASRKRQVLEVMGPTMLIKRREVEFALHIPFKDSPDEVEKIEYVLLQVAQGIRSVLIRYRVENEGIDEAVDDVIGDVRREPGKFRYERLDS